MSYDDSSTRLLSNAGSLINYIVIGVSGNATGKIEYISVAMPGTLTSSASWCIKKLTYDSSGNITNVQFANGNTQFTNIADNYASYSYS